MSIDRPTPFSAALRYLRQKALMPTTGRTRELGQLHADITERALFSAAVDRADILQKFKDLTGRAVAPETAGPGLHVNKAAFRKEARELLRGIGYEINPDGGLTDITSDKRLNLIATMQASEARGYGQFELANDPAVLRAFPAQELFRLRSRKVPRDWLAKWVAAGGKLYGGRMIALKDDPIWSLRLESGGFNRFGRPWPPFDFNSGMWVRPVTRGEAVWLGVITRDAPPPKRQKRTYNEGLQQACKPLSNDLKTRLDVQFANRFKIDDSGVVHFLSVSQGIRQAISGFNPAAPSSDIVHVGTVSRTLRKTVEDKLGPIRLGIPINAEASRLYHLYRKHGEEKFPITDTDLDQLPALVTDENMELITDTFRHKNEEKRVKIRVGYYDLVLEMEKGRLSLITFFDKRNYEKKSPEN